MFILEIKKKRRRTRRKSSAQYTSPFHASSHDAATALRRKYKVNFIVLCASQFSCNSKRYNKENQKKKRSNSTRFRKRTI